MKVLLSHLFLVVSSLCWLALAACAPVSPTPDEAVLTEALPVFHGKTGAPHTVLVYTNPQCPPCRRSWEMVCSLPDRLDPERVRLVILGRGFSSEGTRLLYTAAKLAKQSPETGLAFLTEAMRDPAALSGTDWLPQAISRHAPDLTPETAAALHSPEQAQAYLEMVRRIISAYGLTHTPTIMVDGRKLEQLSVEAVLEQLER
jgi:hypothetical protein